MESDDSFVIVPDDPALVGAANCLLFKRSKRLAPAILLHMAYNIMVTLWA